MNVIQDKCDIGIFLTKYLTNVLSITEAVMWQVAPASFTIREVMTVNHNSSPGLETLAPQLVQDA